MPTDKPHNVLNYESQTARAARSAPSRMEFGLTLTFAVVALLLATFCVWSGTAFLERSRTVQGTGFRDDQREYAHRMFAIAVVFGFPGVWYGYVGVRGLRRGY